MGKKIGKTLKDEASVRSAIAGLIGNDHQIDVLDALEWQVVFHRPFKQHIILTRAVFRDDRLSVLRPRAGTPVAMDLPPVPTGPHPSIEYLTALLAQKLRYLPHERDLVVLSHELTTIPEAHNNSGEGSEVWTSTLVVYGTAEESAMSRCVGLPVALAALRVLDGQVRARGVCGPGEEEVYKPILMDLHEAGLVMQERVREGPKGKVENALGRTWRVPH